MATGIHRVFAILAVALTLLGACVGCAPADEGATSASSATPVSSAVESSAPNPAAHASSEPASVQLASSSASSSDLASSSASPEPSLGDEGGRVVLGDEQFDEYLPLLEGKRVALFSNHSGIVGDVTTPQVPSAGDSAFDLVPFGSARDGTAVSYGQHMLDALVERGVNVVLAFGPEHGFRGTADAGAAVGDEVDEATSVPIRSLYGGAQLSDDDMGSFDTLVVDMQDVGLRYYTYYLTMYHLMDSCAAAGKEVVILDRPNPNGFYVDGPILRDNCVSGVGELPIPVVHGMTWGELAQMINGEGWLSSGPGSCKLTVVPCKNYTHQTMTSLATRPSPNLKDMRAVYLYASTCFFENTAVSVGRGTDFPFEVYGSPYFADVEGCDITFVPESTDTAANPPFLGETCYGVDLRDVDLESIWSEGINMEYLVSAYNDMQAVHPEVSFFGEPTGNGLYWIDWLTGTTDVRAQIEDGWSAAEIEAAWAPDVEAFRQQRAPYLLYEE